LYADSVVAIIAQKENNMSKFNFSFKESQVLELLRGNSEADDWYDAMVEVLPLWQITTVERVAGFISQCSHESQNFRRLSENLNYSATGLNNVFPQYFRRVGRDAKLYHRNPRAIANVVYANRMGNGNTASGDGWRYRGGGLMQLTGKYNYAKFGEAVRMSPEQAIEYVRTKKGAIDSACWFWDRRNLNVYADARDVRRMTKLINGGYNGIDERTENFDHALEVLNYIKPDYKTVKLGSRGPTVRALQEELEITADGIFGPGTEAHLKAWQRANGLVADGIAGPNTLAKIFGE
jgi:putative chitinase